VAIKECKRLVKDMHYEACVQAVITYYGIYLGTKINKVDARKKTLTKDQHIAVNLEH
jgi:hypothetical protein